ncbi:TIGR03620 family F420-dependent LLM class oxidoreductase [Kitasatospora sp. NPDC059646]|uniref:TIGR03620 family F420-dependent LLM class oxidoreductase n=1 Tax=Kitasatospora sp. NPDC059646 TaxID=3346893 RepID=UPI0036872BEF
MKEDQLRRGLGRIGLWTFAFEQQPAAAVREAAAEIDELGYGALWFGEGRGRDSFGQAWLLLDATRRITVASGIADMGRRTAQATAAATRTLDDAHPGRYLLGLGGHRVAGTAGSTPAGPLADTRRYLDELDTAPGGPATETGTDPVRRRLLAALGPAMLRLAATRTAGAHTYFVPPEHTALARTALGPDAVLAVEQAVVLDPDPARARETATAHVAVYTTYAAHQQANLRRLGFTDQDLAPTPGRRLVDALVAHGDLDAVARRVGEHLDAGADHVCLQVLTPGQAELPLPAWRELAAALLPPGAGPAS